MRGGEWRTVFSGAMTYSVSVLYLEAKGEGIA